MVTLFEFTGYMFIGPVTTNDFKQEGFKFKVEGKEWFYKIEFVKLWW
jgi:hypothetical protein